MRYTRSNPPSSGIHAPGFTLIELLVVIAIIGLLTSIAIVSLSSARTKSKDARRAADMKQVATALTLYYNEYAGYPAASASAPVGMTPNFMSTLPTDPTPAGTGCTSGYTYATSGTGYASPAGGTVYPDFSYTFCLGAATGGYAAGQHTLSGKGIQ